MEFTPEMKEAHEESLRELEAALETARKQYEALRAASPSGNPGAIGSPLTQKIYFLKTIHQFMSLEQPLDGQHSAAMAAGMIQAAVQVAQKSMPPQMFIQMLSSVLGPPPCEVCDNENCDKQGSEGSCDTATGGLGSSPILN